MQELRFVAVSEDGTYAVVAVPGRSARFTLPIDERLRAVALGQTSRLAQYEIEVESPLRPKEIQARIRAGETAEEIADAAGLPVERVRWFEGPVLAERAYIASQAQTASVRRQGDSAPGPRLGDIVPERITALGADPQDAEWDSRKRGDGNWQVSLTFPNGGRLHVAEWVFDPRRRHAMPADEAAERLCLPESELPPLPASIPGEATVTPLAPRLGAVASGGLGPVGTGGHGGTGYGGNAPGGYGPAGAGNGSGRFRQDRPAGDRAGVDRPYADRAAQERQAADRPTAYERHSGYDRPAPDRYSPEPYERPAPERHGPDRHPGYERPASYAPQPPASYAQPADSTPHSRTSQPSRPSQPPAHTLSPGHGLVPMWDPPAWNPEPEPARAPAPPADRGAPREELYADRDADDELPSPGWAGQEDPGHGGFPLPAGLAFEDPGPVLARPGPAVQPPAPADDWTTPSRADFTAQADLAAPRAVPAAEPKPAQPKPAQPAAVPVAEPVASESVMTPAQAIPAQAAPVTQDATAHAAPVPGSPPEASPASAPAAAVEAAAGPEPAAAQAPAAARTPAAEVNPKASAPGSATAEPASADEAAGATGAAADEAPAVAEEPKAPAQVAAEPASAPEQPAAEDQQGRPRPAKGPKAKGRRSSVPSWDEIMLGSSRPRD